MKTRPVIDKTILLILLAVSVLFLGAVNFLSAEEKPLSWSFESKEEVAKWNTQYEAEIELSKEYATDGEYSLKLTFPPKGYPGIFIYPEEQDWSKYTYLRFEAYNPGEEVFQVPVMLSDTNGEKAIWYCAFQGKEKSFNKNSLSRLTKSNPKFDLGKVKRLSIEKGPRNKESVIYLDNIRLIPTLPDIVSSLKVPRINDFEAKECFIGWDIHTATLATSTEDAIEGMQSAKVTFLSKGYEWPHVLCRYQEGGYSSRDWSEFGEFAMDIYNPNNEKFTFNVQFRNGEQGNPSFKEKVFSLWIGPNERKTFSLSIPKMAEVIDVKNIDDFIIVTRRPQEDTFIYIDNVRLIPSRGKVTKLSPRKSSYKPNSLPEISCFESKEEVARWAKEGVILEQSIEYAAQGKYSAKAIFSSTGYQWPYLKLSYPGYSSKDWSGFDYLSMDVYNPNEKRFNGSIEFYNSSGQKRPTWSGFGIGTKEKKTLKIPLFVPMGQVSEEAKVKDEFNFNDVASLVISRGKPEQDTTVFFDNITLIPGKTSAIKKSIKLDWIEDKAEKIPMATPILERDVSYSFRFINTKNFLSLEGLGLYKLGRGPVEIITSWFTRGGEGGWPVASSKRELAEIFHTMYIHGTPFIIGLFDPWCSKHRYEDIVENAKETIKLADKVAKDYFAGVALYETEALHYYRIVSEKESRLEKADAHINWVKRFKKDIGITSSKIFFVIQGIGHPYDLDYDAGADIVLQEELFVLNNIQLANSNLRGCARSFRKFWGTDIARWTGDNSWPTKPLPYDKKTGRYSSTPQKFKMDLLWWGWESGKEDLFAWDAYKVHIENYYQGAKYIRGQSDTCVALDTKNREKTREAILKFMDFVKENPRCENVISRIAVVKSKGSYWNSPVHPFNASGHGLSKWIKDGIPLKEEADFDYLETFFPDFFIDEGKLDIGYSSIGNYLDTEYQHTITKNFWTGTPYGAVDIIYPKMKLVDLKKYNSIIFLGYNRMDSVRKDFLDDLMKYVRDGGTILLSIDQLRDSNDNLDIKKLSGFLGVRINSSKKKEIKSHIRVVEPTSFKITKKRYPIAPEVKLYGEKNPWAYDVAPGAATTVAADKDGTPLLLCNKYGKGHVFLFTTPTLSMIPGEKDSVAERSEFIKDVIDKVCKFKPLPVHISPQNDNVEFLISTTGNKEATIFMMNHGEKDWSGNIIVNLKEAGISPVIGEKAVAKIGRGYDVEKITPTVTRNKDNLTISGITLSGDVKDFCSYRQASFAYLELGEK